MKLIGQHLGVIVTAIINEGQKGIYNMWHKIHSHAHLVNYRVDSVKIRGSRLKKTMVHSADGFLQLMQNAEGGDIHPLIGHNHNITRPSP